MLTTKQANYRVQVVKAEVNAENQPELKSYHYMQLLKDDQVNSKSDCSLKFVPKVELNGKMLHLWLEDTGNEVAAECEKTQAVLKAAFDAIDVNTQSYTYGYTGDVEHNITLLGSGNRILFD